MIIQGTAETEAMFTSTMDSGHDLVKIAWFDRTINGVFTVRGRTPFQILPIINIGSGQKVLISA